MRYVTELAPGIASGVTERNPGMSPVIDMETPFVFGAVICVCDTKAQAEKIAALLNASVMEA